MIPVHYVERPDDVAIEFDVRRILVCLDAVTMIAKKGINTTNEDLLEEAEALSPDEIFYLSTILKCFRDYAFDGHHDVEGIEQDSFIDAVASVMTGYRACESFEVEPPKALCGILNAVIARSKISDAAGFDGRDFDWTMLEFFEHSLVEGLTIYELSLLAGMTYQGIVNSVSSSNDFNFVKNKSEQAHLTKSDALAWLKERRGFKPTFLKMSDDSFLTVPVASDGSVFDVSCKAKNGYQIGSAAEERYVENYYEALEQLTQMASPKWRRPSKTSGKFGRVTAVRWASKTKSELGLG